MNTAVRRMTHVLRHRGPDDEGAWVDPAAGVALGHRRLSIVDLSPEGHQPMFSPDGRYVIVFNGEVYNFLEIRKELEPAGFTFRGHSDTEVMLAAICHWGVEPAVRRFNGMMAFALWDRHERTLWLARDRLGKKPLYYGWMGDTFLFGSELKALRAHSDFAGDIDRGALALYLRLGYIPSPYSIYQRIAKLPPGTLLAIRARDCGSHHQPAPYWSAQEAVQRGIQNRFRGSYAEAQEELEALLRDAVKLRMIADVPLGAFLSGGVDSSLVVALMHLAGNAPARTFTIGFREQGHDEAAPARAVAQHLGSEHMELYATPEEAKDLVPKLADIFDEPFGDCSQIPTYLVARLTRGQVTVSLSGDGGDELFGGYGVYFSTRRFRDKYIRLPLAVRKSLKAGLRGFPGERLERWADAVDFQTDEQIHYSLVSVWRSASNLLPGVIEPPTAFTDPARHIESPDFMERMMYLDAVTYLPDDILTKVDRASMAVALEARAPLLDYRVFEFAWRLPLDMKIENGRGKRILRDLLYCRVPRELVERPKQGFEPPISEWLRGSLRPWAEELLSERRLRDDGLIDPGPVRRKWARHLAGTEDGKNPLWIILMLQAWRVEQQTIAETHRSAPCAALPAPR